MANEIESTKTEEDGKALDLEEKIELQVRRVLSELDDKREKNTIESIRLHRDFLMGNTKWVVGGFFGLLLIFGSLIVFIFGKQIDDRYVDAVLGESISETVQTKISAEVDTLSKKAIKDASDAIDGAANFSKTEAIEIIKTSIREEVDVILDSQVRQQIEDAKGDFLRESAGEVALRLIPNGAVLLIDDPTGCPVGWTDLGSSEADIFAGRTIVAVGSAKDRDTRTHRQLGGSEIHLLTIAEIPTHTHMLRRTDQAPRGDGLNVDWRSMGSPNNKSSVDALDATGGSRPHNNMPPFVALFLCKKES